VLFHETLPRDVPLGRSNNPHTTFEGTLLPLKFRIAKTSKIRRDLGQFATLTANISGTNKDIDKWSTALSTTIPSALNKKNW